MKSTVFVKPLEYSLETHGEKWRQGDKISGILKVVNHHPEAFTIPLLSMALVSGHAKKIKNKDKKAWEPVLESTLTQELTLEAGEEKVYPFTFLIPEDARITDKEGSLYLLFQDQLLVLLIEPKLIIMQILEVMEIFLRFKIGPRKFSKGMIEIKLSPPNSREMSHVESLILRIKEVEKTLHLEYTFNMQVFETISGNVILQKKSKQITQTLLRKDYTEFGDSPNQDYLKESISSVVKEAIPKFY